MRGGDTAHELLYGQGPWGLAITLGGGVMKLV